MFIAFPKGPQLKDRQTKGPRYVQMGIKLHTCGHVGNSFYDD